MAESLTNLRTRALRRADRENDPHIGTTGSPSEATTLVNEGYQALWELILSVDEHYFDALYTFTVAAGASTKALSDIVAAGVHRLYDVQRLEGTLYGPPLPVLPEGERGMASELSYYVFGQTLVLEPASLAPGSYQAKATPMITNLSNDNDTIHAAIPTGWDRFIVNHAAMEMIGKSDDEDGRIRDLRKDQDALTAIITNSAARRISGQKRVGDVRQARHFRNVTKTGHFIG